MKKLGILTEKGQKTISVTNNALQYIGKKFNVRYQNFSEKHPVPIDGIFTKDNKCVAIYEAKTRDGYIENEQFVFRDKKYDTVLIVKDKLVVGKRIADTLALPFVMINIFDNFVYIWHINNTLLASCESKNTFTKSDINGGLANRENIFIPLKLADKKFIYEKNEVYDD